MQGGDVGGHLIVKVEVPSLFSLGKLRVTRERDLDCGVDSGFWVNPGSRAFRGPGQEDVKTSLDQVSGFQ